MDDPTGRDLAAELEDYADTALAVTVLDHETESIATRFREAVAEIRRLRWASEVAHAALDVRNVPIGLGDLGISGEAAGRTFTLAERIEYLDRLRRK